MIIQSNLSYLTDNITVTSKTCDSTFDNNWIRSALQAHFTDGSKVHLPLDKIIVSSDFGIRRDPFTKKRRWHSGIDLRAKHGQKAYATLPGVVKAVGRDKGRGIFVSLTHGDYTVTYCHLSRSAVKPQQTVNAGDVVGYVGTTGRSTGPHLHLSLHKGAEVLNPIILLRYLLMKIRQREAINVCQGSLAIPSMICRLAI